MCLAEEVGVSIFDAVVVGELNRRLRGLHRLRGWASRRSVGFEELRTGHGVVFAGVAGGRGGCAESHRGIIVQPGGLKI